MGLSGFSSLETQNFGSGSNFLVFLHTLVGAFFARETNSACQHCLIGGYQGFPGLDSGKLGNFGLGRVSDFSGFLNTLVGVLAAREMKINNHELVLQKTPLLFLTFKCILKWTNFPNLVSQGQAGMWPLFELFSWFFS